MEKNNYHVPTDEEVAAIAKKCVADAEAAVKARSAPRDSTEDPPPREATPGEIFAGVAMLAGAVVLIAWGINHYSAQAVAAETASSISGGASKVIFECISDPEAAKTAAWQMVSHLDKAGQIMRTAAHQVARVGQDFALAAGDVFRQGFGQTGFHQVYVPSGEALPLSGVTDVCPAVQMIPGQ